MSKVPCSVPILTLNVEKKLERLLPIIVPFFDDVFIMDGNSTDGTLDVAKRNGVRIERQFDTQTPNQKITDFRKMRLRLWERARYRWLFLLDADMIPTQEALKFVQESVDLNNNKIVYFFNRRSTVSGGQIVKHALYYPFYYPHLFSLDSGVKMAERSVHERLIFPEDVSKKKIDEAIILDPLEDIFTFKKKQRHYLSLEQESIKDSSIFYLLKWIWWYNLRSFAGQITKSIRSFVLGVSKREVSLPLRYTICFLEYRILSLVLNTGAWWRLRNSRK